MKFFGIYKITNLVDGKMYIGQHTTTDIDDGYMGSGKRIIRAVNKYGVQNFRKEWIMFCEDQEELNYMERVFVDQTWVDRADTYNIALGGITAKFSEQYRQHLSESCKRCQNRESVRMAKSKFQKEYKNRPEVKARMSAMSKQMFQSMTDDERHTWRNKIRKSSKKRIPVVMFDGSGKVIFDSLREAAKATGYHRMAIKMHCISKQPLDGKTFIFNNNT